MYKYIQLVFTMTLYALVLLQASLDGTMTLSQRVQAPGDIPHDILHAIAARCTVLVPPYWVLHRQIPLKMIPKQKIRICMFPSC